jgi:polyhydroxyalkanoate synthesis regulator phasin
MTVDRGLLERIKTRGEEVLTQVSSELMSNPRFMKAMEGAMRGKERLEKTVGKVLKQMNVPTRTELKRALSRIETLERDVATLKARGAGRPGASRKTPTKRKAARKA